MNNHIIEIKLLIIVNYRICIANIGDEKNVMFSMQKKCSCYIC